MTDAITYSVVVPVYNSEQSLPELCARIVKTLSDYTFEIILVDDGSGDKSWPVIERLKQEHARVLKAIRLQKNYGQHAALLCALRFARGQYTITIDDDLQYHPEDIVKLIQKQTATNADVVYGSVAHSDITVKDLGSTYIKKTSRLNGSPLRLIKKSTIEIILANHNSSFIFLDEILQWYTSAFAFVEVQHYPRKYGKTGYGFKKLWNLYQDILSNYSVVPIKIFANVGFIFSFIFFFVGCVFIYRKFIHHVPMGYTSLIVAILFSTSITIFGFGGLGLYLFKMYLTQQNKPLYVIKEML